MSLIIAKFNYWMYIVLMMMGLYAVIAKRNYVKKLLGMAIFQTAVILFYVSTGVKKDSTIPVIVHHAPAAQTSQHAQPGTGQEAHPAPGGHHEKINPDEYANPLPHVLMLTAIVVGVATLGVGLAVIQKIYSEYGTVEEHEILEQLSAP